MNRIGRRAILAMLLIAAVVAVWALVGGPLMSWSREFGEPTPLPCGPGKHLICERFAKPSGAPFALGRGIPDLHSPSGWGLLSTLGLCITFSFSNT